MPTFNVAFEEVAPFPWRAALLHWAEQLNHAPALDGISCRDSAQA